MNLIKEFKAFVAKGNVVDLAVAVVIGQAFGKIVNATVEGLIMPLVSYVLPSGNWQTLELGKLQVGKLLAAGLDFVLIAMVIFLVFVKGLGKFLHRKDAQALTQVCPHCLESIPAGATRCKFCTSEI